MIAVVLEVLWQLFSSFFVIGLFTFGGGYAVISLIQTEVVVKHAWLSEAAFTDIVGVSQMTPGPIGINCATYTGYEVLSAAGAGHVAAVIGSVVATLAVVLPSFLVVLALVRFYSRYRENAVFQGVMSALRPAVVGLLAAAALILVFSVSFGDGLSLTLLKDNFPDWKSFLLCAAGFVAAYFFRVGPLPVLLAAGILGVLLY